MPSPSDFRLGADVNSSDGARIGTLVSVIVEEEGFAPRSLVVRAEESPAGLLRAADSIFVTDQVVIPMTAVESATHDAVTLSMSGAELRRQPLYLSYRPKPPSMGEVALEDAEILTGGIGTPNVEEFANKGEDEIEIDQGENVMLGTTGRRLGRVQDVLFDHGELIAVVITPDGLFKRDVVLPRRFLSRSDDMALFAQLDESEIDQLKVFIDTD
jgi:sporulation protein YlmC with PRC-barrel domain